MIESLTQKEARFLKALLKCTAAFYDNLVARTAMEPADEAQLKREAAATRVMIAKLFPKEEKLKKVEKEEAPILCHCYKPAAFKHTESGRVLCERCYHNCGALRFGWEPI